MVVIGVTLIVAVNGLSAGIRTYITSEFEGLGPNLLVITADEGAFGGYGSGSDRENVIIKDSTIDQIARTNGVKYAVPFFQDIITLISSNKEKMVPVIGADTEKLPLIFPRFDIDRGSYLTSTDNYGILLGSQLGDVSNDPIADIGDVIRVKYQKISGSVSFAEMNIETKTKSFTVRGVGKETGMSSSTLPFDRSAYLSLSAANQLFDRNYEYDGICVLTVDPSWNDQVEDSLKDRYDFNIISPRALQETYYTINTVVGGFINSIALISLFVASIGVITTLWTSMMERTHEIGTLRALGYTRRQILLIFLDEAILVGLFGGFLGLGTGILAGYFLTIYITLVIPFGGSSTITANFEPMMLLTVWLGAIAVSGIAGFYPAKKAANLDPVIALRKD